MKTFLVLSLHAACLVAAVVIGPKMSRSLWATVLFWGLTMGQICLLGMWTAFTRRPTHLRLCGAIVGTAAVWGTRVVASRESWGNDPSRIVLHYGVLSFVGVGVITLICMGIHRWWMRLARLGVDVPMDYEAKVQFSVRDIFSVTAFYAGMLAVGKAFAESTDDSKIPLFAVYRALSFVAIPVAATWAALGLNRPILRTTAAMFVIGLNSVFIPILISGQYAASLTMFLTAGMIVFLSLLGLRSDGYRIVPLRRSSGTDSEQ